MAFNSLQFAGFFLLVFGLVALLNRSGLLDRTVGRLLPGRFGRRRRILARNTVLLVASYVFYGAWDVRFLALIFFSTVVDFVCGLRIYQTPSLQRKRQLLAVSVITNLGLLGVFKYFDFFSQSLAELVGIDDPVLLNVILPVGISFYTFQTLSYSFDIYAGRLRPSRRFVDFATFVAFFPQLVAGPIERARDLLPQFQRMRPITGERIERGLHFIAQGLFKKVVVADNVALVADAAFALSNPTGLQSLVGVYAFAIQIYCDFSGYTDIARGTACCMGFDLTKNFDLPYFSSTPSEFWRRWHISLSSWLRDYLYIPLGGNRYGAGRTLQNLLITMVLGGLWHGAAWTFAAWGLFHGLILIAYRVVEVHVRVRLPSRGLGAMAARVIGIVFYFHITCVSWLLFRAESLEQAWRMFRSLPLRLLGEGSVTLPGPWGAALALTLLLVVVQVYAYRRKEEAVFLSLHPVPRGLVYGVGLLLFLLVGSDGASPFIYFQF